MVFFTCNHCGESVKKPAVEKHYNQKCRGAPVSVSCMDCQKDFYGEEFVAHTKCISEAEKYSGKDYVAKDSKNSGQKKQDSWMEIVHSILDSSDYNLTPSVRGAFQRLQSYDNVPRKKAKFENFIKNCLRMSPKDATQVWDILEKELQKTKAANAKPAPAAKKEEEVKPAAPVAEPVAEEGVAEKKKSKKSKRPLEETNGTTEPAAVPVPTEEEPSKKKKKETPVEVPAEESAPVNAKFDWTESIVKVLTKSNELAVEKLKKKVLKKYFSHTQAEVTSEKQERKLHKTFQKYLKKSNVKVDGELVKLAC